MADQKDQNQQPQEVNFDLDFDLGDTGGFKKDDQQGGANQGDGASGQNDSGQSATQGQQDQTQESKNVAPPQQQSTENSKDDGSDQDVNFDLDFDLGGDSDDDQQQDQQQDSGEAKEQNNNSPDVSGTSQKAEETETPGASQQEQPQPASQSQPNPESKQPVSTSENKETSPAQPTPPSEDVQKPSSPPQVQTPETSQQNVQQPTPPSSEKPSPPPTQPPKPDEKTQPQTPAPSTPNKESKPAHSGGNDLLSLFQNVSSQVQKLVEITGEGPAYTLEGEDGETYTFDPSNNQLVISKKTTDGNQENLVFKDQDGTLSVVFQDTTLLPTDADDREQTQKILQKKMTVFGQMLEHSLEIAHQTNQRAEVLKELKNF